MKRKVLQSVKLVVVSLGLATLLASCASSTPPAAPARPVATPIAVVAAATVLPPATALPTAPLVATAVVASVTPAPAAALAATPSQLSPTPLSTTIRQQIFTEVWTTIDENYLYPDFGGTDWLAVREEFAARVSAVGSDEEFYQLVAAMVGRLNDEHSRFLPPSAAQKQDVLTSGREEQVGVGVITLPLRDALLIQHVLPGSPAERAGLRPRDRIVAIDGVIFSLGDIQGPAGSQVRLTVVRPGDRSRDIVIIRRQVEGRITPSARRLEGDIGYLNVTTLWVNDMADQVGAALAELNSGPPLRGLILDLRSNPGGWRSVLTGILGHFVHGSVGSFTSRKGDMPLVIEPGVSPDLRGLPLVVLVDGGTASYAELLAAVLQRQAGAVVLGVPSAGNTETIYSYELSGGARLWVAQEGFELIDGAVLEGKGVKPDITLPADWTRFSEAADPGITEAMRLLTRGAGGQ